MYNKIQVGAGTTREAVEKCWNEFRLKGMWRACLDEGEYIL